MRRYYARNGEIPKPGEVWLPVGDKAHLMMILLIDNKRVEEAVNQIIYKALNKYIGYMGIPL